MDEPVFRGCPMTGRGMLRVLSGLVNLKLTKIQLSAVFSGFKEVTAGQLDLNLITSEYQLTQLQGVQSAADYVVHVCNAGKDKDKQTYCPGHTYDKLTKDEWLAHKDDECPYCHTSRFIMADKPGSPGVIELTPRWSMSYFGWDTVVKSIMERKEVMTRFRRARGEAPPPGSFRASPAWREMQPRLPEVVANSPNTAHFILGVDWMTMGKNGTWSVGVIMVKLLDVPPEVCGKRVNSSVLAIIDGGQHQPHLTGFLDLICRDIRQHVLGPGDLGVLVEPHPGPGVDGVAPARVEPVRIYGVPVMSIADTPAAATWSRGMGHSALKLCLCCNISKPPNPPTEKAPLGYSTPTLQTLPGNQQQDYVYIWDVRMKFTHEEIMQRGAPFRHGWSTREPREAGCHGQPLLPLLLPWLDARFAYLVAVEHCLLYGLLKHLLEWWMSAEGLDGKVRQEMEKRCKAIQSPSDFGRDLGDIVNRQGWRMEDFKHWLLYFSPIVLRGNLLPQPHRGIWAGLEGACIHYLTPGAADSATPVGMAAGHAHLQTYTANLELCRKDPQLANNHWDNQGKLTVPSNLFSPNTHTSSCRLKVQEENVGRTCLFGELWIERVLHDLKSITTSGIPGPQLDAHIAKRAAMQNASSKLHDRTDPDGQQDYNARLRDEVFGDGQQALLLGAGSTVCPLPNSPGAMVQGCIKAVEDVRASDDNTPWRTHHVKRLFAEPLTPEEAEEEAREAPRVAGPAAVDLVRYYQRAECNGTTVLSRVYKRPFKRNSTWASMPFRTSSDTIVIWAGHVQFWVRLEHPKLPGVYLRLAARLYPDHSRRLQQEQEQEQEQEQPIKGNSRLATRMQQVLQGQAALAEPSSTGLQQQRRQPAQPRPSALGGMHKGYGDEHLYMFEANRIHTVFVCSFEDGEGYGRMYFVPANNLSRS
ncbi:hypothetical protein V8C86DRAFT_3028984 [Haematococcus lacustris]